MPDITMCTNQECPQADNCWRFGCPPNFPHQSYQKFEPEQDDDEFKCSWFIKYPDYELPKIENGTIVRFKNDDTRDWVCIHHTKCDMSFREKCRKNVKDHTGFYLFGGLWGDGDPLTGDPYGKCKEQLKIGMFNALSIVGHISKDLEAYKTNGRI